MTPYKENQKVMVDPTVEELFFGSLPHGVKKGKTTGTIVERQYSQKWRCMTYLVAWKNANTWFKEKELIPTV